VGDSRLREQRVVNPRGLRGAPLAGKTTSVGALGQALVRPVGVACEIGGNSLFRLVTTRGGLFEGHRIRCQIVSAPGQGFACFANAGDARIADVVGS